MSRGCGCKCKGAVSSRGSKGNPGTNGTSVSNTVVETIDTTSDYINNTEVGHEYDTSIEIGSTPLVDAGNYKINLNIPSVSRLYLSDPSLGTMGNIMKFQVQINALTPITIWSMQEANIIGGTVASLDVDAYFNVATAGATIKIIAIVEAVLGTDEVVFTWTEGTVLVWKDAF